MPLFDILSILPHRPTIKIIDVGAMSLGAGTDPYQKLLETGLATVVGFEPNQKECDKLQAAAGKGRIYLPYAIGDGSRKTLNLCNFAPASSLLEPDLAVADRFHNLGNLMQVVQREPIETRRLDDLPEVAGADFLKIDVQGAELEVLAGARQLLGGVVVVHTEVEFVPLYRDQPLFAEIDRELRSAGFLFHLFTSIMGRPFKPIIGSGGPNRRISQMLWADAVFVSSFMELDRLPPVSLLKLAIILHIQYESVDLALVALARYDAKSGTGIAKVYLERLAGPSQSQETLEMLRQMSSPDKPT